jgi:hypothetical protein
LRAKALRELRIRIAHQLHAVGMLRRQSPQGSVRPLHGCVGRLVNHKRRLRRMACEHVEQLFDAGQRARTMRMHEHQHGGLIRCVRQFPRCWPHQRHIAFARRRSFIGAKRKHAGTAREE